MQRVFIATSTVGGAKYPSQPPTSMPKFNIYSYAKVQYLPPPTDKSPPDGSTAEKESHTMRDKTGHTATPASGYSPKNLGEAGES